MINILDQKTYIFINEYYAIHFYQMKPIAKYYLMKKIICNMYIILFVIYFISYIHMMYYALFILYLYA